MRPIKFRGKLVNSDKWVEGYLYQTNQSKQIRIITSTMGDEPTDWDVQPETVGQSTGLRDCSETEIYEGDIITAFKGNYPRVVLWDKVSWALMPCEYFYDKHFWVMNLQHPGNDWWEEFADEMKVVGNIYDNPELLKLNSNDATL